MKQLDRTTGTFKDVYVKALDSLPVGSEIDFDGNTSDIPVGWEQVSEKAQILWTNPNPTSNFTPQTITLLSSDYDYYEIISKINSSANYFVNQSSIKGVGIRTQLATLGGSVFRNIDFIDNTHLDVGNISGSDNEKNNAQLIPIYIIGYKTGLFN